MRGRGALLGVLLIVSIAACGSELTTLMPVPAVPAAPAPPFELSVVPICIGVPLIQCRDMATSSAETFAGQGRPEIFRITLRCTAICTRTKGEGTSRIDYVDGTHEESSWGYESSGG